MSHDDDTCQEKVLPPDGVDENLSNDEDFTPVGDTKHGHVGAAVRLLRKLCGWSQGTLAEKAGVHLNTVHRFEANPDDAETQTLGKLAGALGHSPAHLMLLAEHLTPDGHLDLVRLVLRATPTEVSSGFTPRGDNITPSAYQRGPIAQEPSPVEMSASGRRAWPLVQYVLQSEELSTWLEEAVRRQLAAPGKSPGRRTTG